MSVLPLDSFPSTNKDTAASGQCWGTRVQMGASQPSLLFLTHDSRWVLAPARQGTRPPMKVWPSHPESDFKCDFSRSDRSLWSCGKGKQGAAQGT